MYLQGSWWGQPSYTKGGEGRNHTLQSTLLHHLETAIQCHVDNGCCSRPSCMYPHTQLKMFIQTKRRK